MASSIPSLASLSLTPAQNSLITTSIDSLVESPSFVELYESTFPDSSSSSHQAPSTPSTTQTKALRLLHTTIRSWFSSLELLLDSFTLPSDSDDLPPSPPSTPSFTPETAIEVERVVWGWLCDSFPGLGTTPAEEEKDVAGNGGNEGRTAEEKVWEWFGKMDL